MSEKILWLLDNVDRIGHIFMEPFVIKNLIEPDPDKVTILVPGFRKAANNSAFEYTKKRFNVNVCNDRNLFSLLFKGDPEVINQLAGQGITVRKWTSDLWEGYISNYLASGGAVRYFSFDQDEIGRGYRLQQRLGIPEDAKVIAFHNRESGYLPRHQYHSFRDADVNNFLPAIEYLTRLGYWVVRVGDSTMKKLPSMERVIDLPFENDVDEFADLWFLGSCEFMIGNSSGPMVISYVFKRPRLMFNMIGSGNCYATEHDLYLPKRLRSINLGRDLTLSESAGQEFGRAEKYIENGLEVIENSPEEILEAVKEMLDRIYNKPYINGRRKLLQRRYRQVLEEINSKDPNDWAFKMKYLEPTEISYSFLEKHPSYLV